MSKERDQATYDSVMSSPLMTPQTQQVYWVLWSAMDGMTRGEIKHACEAQQWQEDETNTWSKTVSLMSKMGLVEKGNKKHCPVAGKEDQLWEITNKTQPIKPKANKPAAKMFERGVEQLEVILATHDARGDGLVTEDVRRVFEWVKDKVPSKAQ